MEQKEPLDKADVAKLISILITSQEARAEDILINLEERYTVFVEIFKTAIGYRVKKQMVYQGIVIPYPTDAEFSEDTLNEIREILPTMYEKQELNEDEPADLVERWA